MESLPYFFNLLKNNHLINLAVTTRRLTETDLAGFDYVRNSRNEILLKHFVLAKHEKFDTVTVFISSFGVLIDFISKDLKYFDNTVRYFNTKAVARSKPPVTIDDQVFKIKGKRIGTQDLFAGTLQVDVLRSDLYGCKIMTSFHSKKMTNQFNREPVSTESEFLSNIRSIK
jgi:hypothetical protein